MEQLEFDLVVEMRLTYADRMRMGSGGRGFPAWMGLDQLVRGRAEWLEDTRSMDLIVRFHV